MNFLQRLANSGGLTRLKKLAADGKLTCPQCRRPERSAPSETNAILTCRSCGHFAKVEEWIDGRADRILTGKAGSRPPESQITAEIASGFYTWNIPATRRVNPLLVVGWLWCAFMVIFSFFSGLSVFQGGVRGFSDSGGLIIFLVGGGVFWAVGLGLLYAGDRIKNARYGLTVGGGRITMMREWRGKRSEKSLDLQAVKSISQVVFYSQNHHPVYGVEIRGERGKLRFGSALTPEEKAWLVAELQSAVWPERARAREKPSTSIQKTFSISLPKTRILLFGGIFGMIMGGIFVFVSWKFMPGFFSRGGKAEGDGFVRAFSMASDFLSHGGRAIFFIVGTGAFLGGASAVIAWFRGAGTERTLAGTERHIILRKTRKGLTLQEKIFPREDLRAIRTSVTGETNGRPMKKVELLIGNRSETIVRWLESTEADDLADAIRAATGKE